MYVLITIQHALIAFMFYTDCINLHDNQYTVKTIYFLYRKLKMTHTLFIFIYFSSGLGCGVLIGAYYARILVLEVQPCMPPETTACQTTPYTHNTHHTTHYTTYHTTHHTTHHTTSHTTHHTPHKQQHMHMLCELAF